MFGNSGSDLGAYVSYRNRVRERLIWELGVRWDTQDYVQDADDTQVSPRFNLSYALNDRAEQNRNKFMVSQLRELEEAAGDQKLAHDVAREASVHLAAVRRDDLDDGRPLPSAKMECELREDDGRLALGVLRDRLDPRFKDDLSKW